MTARTERDWAKRLRQEHRPLRTWGDDVALGTRLMIGLLLGWLLFSIWPEAIAYSGAFIATAWALGRAAHWLSDQ